MKGRRDKRVKGKSNKRKKVRQLEKIHIDKCIIS